MAQLSLPIHPTREGPGLLSKKVIAVSQDAKLQKRLASGLMSAGGAVETVSSVSELSQSKLEADLVVCHMADKGDPAVGTLLAKLPSETPVVVVVPTSDLNPI